MATVSLRQKYRRPPAVMKQGPDDDSDLEDGQPGLRRTDGRESQNIHSGHFMMSSPHSEHPPKKGYDFDTVNKQTCQTYRFGKASTSHFSIDASLTKLFECMTLAYSGKLVSPKWKNFKGLKLLWRDKIRLNNAIWRAWYIHYVEKRENPVCHFVTPLEGSIDLDVHRPEAMVTEGKCWKRRIEIVIREYHKWRTYFKKRLQKHKDDDLSSLLKDEDSAARRGPRKNMDTTVPMELDNLFDMDVLMSEFSDTLFSTHQSMAWPNPKEIAHAWNADMIQPGLIPLQPNLDFMDSFDPLQDLFHSLRQPNFPSVSPTASSVPSLSSSSGQSQVQLMSSMQLSGGPLPGQTGGSADGSYVQSYMPLFPGPVAPGAGPAVVSSVSQHLSHEALAQCLPGGPVVPGEPVVPVVPSGPSPLDSAASPSVITHTASPGVTPGEAAEFGPVSSQAPPPLPSRLQQLNLLAAAQPPQTFALPRPFQASNTNKVRPVQRIAPASPLPPPQVVFTAPFPGHTSAVIVTPTPLKADSGATSHPGVVIASHLGAAPGFHVVPPTQNPSASIVLKHKSPPCSHQTASSTVVLGQTGAGQGASCLLDQAPSPSPQSHISSSSGLVKNEQCQSRRATFVSSEQKRRSNINTGFKTLCSLVPALKCQSYISNAVTLQKTVDHIGKLQQERQQLQEELKRLREEIEELDQSISLCQEQLPPTGVPVKRNELSHMQEMFNQYVKSQTLHNWKFWIFSIIIKPLFSSFTEMVSTSSPAELYQTTTQWLERHCLLPALRPMVLNTLRHLSKTTPILSDPSLLPEEAVKAVTKTDM